VDILDAGIVFRKNGLRTSGLFLFLFAGFSLFSLLYDSLIYQAWVDRMPVRTAGVFLELIGRT